MTFQQLQSKFNISKEHFYGYLQVRHFISSMDFPTSLPVTYNAVEKFLLDRRSVSHFISAFYALLHSLNSDDVIHITQKWERDLATDYTKDDWLRAIKIISSTFTCNRLRETQYKIFHRLHLTPYVFNKMNQQTSALCKKCQKEVGTYYHYLWHCKLIKRFWGTISQELSGIFQVAIKRDPGFFILGLPFRHLTLTHLQLKLCDKLLPLARKCVLINWIKDLPPTATQWYKEIFRVLPHERISAVLKGNERHFTELWSPLFNYLQKDLSGLVLKGQKTIEWPNTLRIT